MKLFFGVLLALPVFGMAQQTEGSSGSAKFTITGTVKGLSENSRVSLTDASNPTDTVAEARVKGGQFVLNGHVSEPNLYELNFDAAKKKSPLFMGNDKMQLSGSTDNLSQLKTSGSPSNDDFVAFEHEFTPYFVRLNAGAAMLNSPSAASKRDSLVPAVRK